MEEKNTMLPLNDWVNIGKVRSQLEIYELLTAEVDEWNRKQTGHLIRLKKPVELAEFREQIIKKVPHRYKFDWRYKQDFAWIKKVYRALRRLPTEQQTILHHVLLRDNLNKNELLRLIITLDVLCVWDKLHHEYDLHNLFKYIQDDNLLSEYSKCCRIDQKIQHIISNYVNQPSTIADLIEGIEDGTESANTFEINIIDSYLCYYMPAYQIYFQIKRLKHARWRKYTLEQI